MEHAQPTVERRARWGQRRALIKVGYSCNDHCVFCHTDDYRHSGDASTAALVAKIDMAARQGYDMVVLSGGEATMRPDLYKLARRVKDRGMLLGFITNGRVMSYPEVVERLVSYNLRYVHLSIHGPERVHNKLTGDRSFAQSYQGLQNLNGRGLDLTVSCVVTKQNLAHLRGVVDLMQPLEDVVVKFSVCEPKGAALRNRAAVVPTLEEAGKAISDALEYGTTALAGKGIRLAVENLPFCLMPKFRHLDDDLLANRLLTMSEVWDGGLVDIDDFNKVKGPGCAGCSEMEKCPGIFVETFQQEGDAFVRPFGRAGEALEEARGGFLPPEQARLDVNPAYPDTALVTMLVPECDNSCHFCDVPGGGYSGRPSTLDGVCASLRAMRGRAKGVLFTGGEPTHLPWFLDAVRVARDYGYETITVQTHGGAASEESYANAMREAGVTGVDIPLYSGTARGHEAVTRTPGSFKKTLRGIRNLQAQGVKVVLHTTLFAGAEEHARSWAKGVLDLGVDSAYAQWLGPSLSESGAEVGLQEGKDAVAIITSILQDFPFRFSGIAPCDSGTLSPWNYRLNGPPAGPPALPYQEWLRTFMGSAEDGHEEGCAVCDDLLSQVADNSTEAVGV